MFPKIIIFSKVPADGQNIFIHDRITGADFIPLVDSVHGSDMGWISKQLDAGNCRLFYWIAGELHMEEKLLEFEDADFMISYNLAEHVSRAGWVTIFEYFEKIIKGEKVEFGDQPYFEKAIFSANTLNEEMVTVELDDDYSFIEGFVDDMDVALFEIKKPNTPVPYTIVVRNYSKIGHIPIFTSLFICPSWGVNRMDAAFLKHLWQHLKMVGEFNLDELLKNHT